MATSVVPLARDMGWPYRDQFDNTITVTLQEFAMPDDTGGHRRRPIKVEGAVRDSGGRPRDELFSIADIRPDGTYDVRNPSFGIGGHLLAVSLSGLDLPPNIAPVSKPTNDRMGEAERELRKQSFAPRYLEVEIPAYYGTEEDPRVPKEFHYKLYEKPTKPVLGGNNLIYEKRVVQDWGVAGPSDYPARELANADQAARWVRLSGWCIEKSPAGSSGRDFSFLAGHLPPLDERPLAYLDYLIICYPKVTRIDERVIAEYIHGIALGVGFKRPSREIAIKGNILRNRNWLRSDAFGKKSMAVETKDSVVIEPFDVLSCGGGLDAPHVDHIVPQSLDGPNCFSNAQITSHSYNTQKGNRTKQFQFRSEEWKKEMIEKMKGDDKLKGFFG